MMFNIGWGEMLVLVIAGLVILGPERLPGAIRWTAGSLKQVRDYLGGATSQLRQDLGPEFEDLRQPLSELQKLRGMSPRQALTKHLLDGDDSFLTGNFGAAESSEQPKPLTTPEVNGVPPVPGSAPAHQPGVTPFDLDAT
ncbi:Sec-independent protein translocase subunit TatB [Mycobacterium sp. CBMA293]|uniref:Sec-independent protein translocase protein TatB n=1 Tax=unclassified Mycolicibacterium TaxID=2636767 RepID=UPI0012DDA765|nr:MULTISPECIES: Sec-independent protein translocase protein TatB [unclassified Mycolicibacterium]MUL45957.1 Sec-independent protein translocase subunit TatB [Mycolicibacterium sp. CBMA 360]MUL60629.1 Sec-independent protein translocase subunit TatB [Mycolicibacterium sp. CBMA 335]MUL72444.1 Sec-independent protein translocase subunit TatB [Mycolicibacterium sp. CBMA 311]MUL95155.1 Sec-independent protein translocase subunit TatB [Mycolicibacterium sp. CBMA 230]MUM13796.1 Sec-independent prote